MCRLGLLLEEVGSALEERVANGKLEAREPIGVCELELGDEETIRE